MARELNETQIKDKLVAFVQYLLNTPEKATFFCVDGQIRQPNEILKAKGLPEKKLHFKLDFLLDFLKGIVDFPNEYIKIKVGGQIRPSLRLFCLRTANLGVTNSH